MSARKIALGSALIVALGLVLCWMLFTFTGVGMLSRDPAGWQAQAAPAIEAIQRYHADHGRYPDSLEEVGVELPETRFGPWRYRRATQEELILVVPASEAIESCELAVGDYMSHGFVFYWSSRNGWHMDT